MTSISQMELETLFGGQTDFPYQDWNWGVFFGTVGWVLAAGCGASLGNPAVCGAAIAVGGVNIFFF